MQLTHAAPPFDIDLLLDELLEMNIRMGDIILKAKYERKELKANELKDTSIGVIDSDGYGDNNRPFAANILNNPIIPLDDQESNSTDEDSQTMETEIVTESEASEDNKNPAGIKRERSFVGQAFDGLRNRWNGWFNREKFAENEETQTQDDAVVEDGNEDEVSETVSDAVVIDDLNNNDDDDDDDVQRIDEPNVNGDSFSDQNCFGTLDPLTDNTEPDNVEQVNIEPPENVEPEDTVSSHPGDQEDGVNHEEDWGEETFNDESEDDEGWFGNVIDKIVNFFS